MTAIFAAPTRFSLADAQPVVYPSGRGALLFPGGAFISAEDADDARLTALGLLELANRMEAAQRTGADLEVTP
jgi:hypothetical protein